MISVVEFKPEHIDQMDEQEAAAYLNAYITPEDIRALAEHSAFTFLNDDGRVLGSFGVLQYWPGRGEAWAFLDRNCRSQFLAMTNAARRFLDVHPSRRIEATVDAEFTAGHRWIKALGFEMEAPRLRAYRPDGGDVVLYARVR